MRPEVFFLLGALCAGHALLASFRGRAPLTMAWFVGAWLTGELALFHLAWQVALSAYAVATGALDRSIGWWGLGLMALSWVGLLLAHHRARQAEQVIDEALGPDVPATRRPVPRGLLLRPFRFEVDGVEVLRDLSYGPHGKLNTLDVYRPEGHTGPAPTLVHVHGGSWMHGRKERQAKPLTWRLAADGWVVVAVNYRLSPVARFPDHLDDVQAAVAWVRDHADELGVDPGFIVLTGGSAGGHLAALAALDPTTGVQGCVPHYGIYDPLDGFRSFFQRVVIGCAPDECPECWAAASPMARVHGDAPPFFVIHGTFDSLSPVGQARTFVRALREAGVPVAFAELPAAQHAFDTFHSVRSTHVVNGVARWLTGLHERHLARTGDAAQHHV